MTTYYARSNLVIFGPKKKSLKIAVKPWDFYEKFRGTNICIPIPQTTIYSILSRFEATFWLLTLMINNPTVVVTTSTTVTTDYDD